jgi:hypothetical protein
MKKCCILLLAVFLFSCSNGLKKDGNMFIGKTTLKNGASEQKEISYKVDPFVVDELKLDKSKIDELFKDAMIEAKASLKNPMTFDFLPTTENSGMIYSSKIDTTLNLSVDYIGQNAFGVKSKNLGIIQYDKKTLQILKKTFM